MHKPRSPFSLPSLSVYVFCCSLLLLVAPSQAQTLKARISGSIENTERSTLPGSMSPRVRSSEDTGQMAPDTRISGATITFAPSAAQQADLDSLIAAQQNAASPLYHQWLTPEQFGARFGMADADLAKVEAWLQQQGFTVDAVARGRNQITFSGTAGDVASAFGAALHTYRSGGETHFAPSGDLSLPAALAGSVAGVGNLSTFGPRPHLRQMTPQAVGAKFTSSQTGNHFLTPKDIATIYDIAPAYNAGYTGAGQTIAVVGRSTVLNTDIANFQTAAGLPVVAPTPVLVPNSGTPVVRSGDESESDLDLEYSGAIAPGATLLLVYVGNNANYSVFSALDYAISERIAPIVSISYGSCEANYSSASYAAANVFLAQAATQGQTIVAAAGDAGSTDCFGVSGLATATQQALAVDFPSSSAYVTGLGGTEFSTANTAAANTTYWTGASGSDVVSSALSYIPEQVWNDDSVTSGVLNLSSGGGGASIYSGRPLWQTGVPGIPAGSSRLVPDVSLTSSPTNAGYLYCSSDSSTGVSGSCSTGFRDVNNSILTVAGGTSFAAPIFAGMVALVNQSQSSTGQGLINPTLYTLAANPTTYATAFHDVTSGTNGCTSGALGCSAAGTASFAATAGYDEATGLGSVDLYKLLTAWPASSGGSTALAASTLTLSAATTAPAAGAADTITLQVAAKAGTGSVVPTGTISLVVDGGAATPVTLANGTATYSFSSATAGSHTIVATYSGDLHYAASSSTLVLTVGTPPNTAAFAVAVPNITVTAGNSATTTVRINASNGYAGTVSWTLVPSSSISSFCYSISNLAVGAGSTQASTTLTVYTSSSACSTATTKAIHTVSVSSAEPGAGPAGTMLSRTGQVGLAFAGVFGLALFSRRGRRLRPLLSLIVLVGLGAGLSGCSNDSSASSTSTTAKTAAGTYTFTLTGTDTVSPALNASTNFTVVVN